MGSSIAFEIGTLIVFCLTVVGALAKLLTPQIKAVEDTQKSLKEDLDILRQENTDQHKEGRDLQRKVEDKLDHHLTVDHPRMTELLARIDERQRLMTGED
jgi:uncharacterized protein YoxC